MSDERAKLTQRAAIASVSVASFLLVLKGYAAWTTGSVAMLGSLADTGLDVIASLITLSGVRIAAMPADHDHRFGHGKAESLAALVQVGIIGISAIGIGWRAVDRLVHGATTANAEYGIGVSVIAIIATLGLILFQRSVVRRTGSVAIKTDSVHYSSDLLLNLSVIVALVLDQYAHLPGVDPVFGILIALWLFYGAWRASAHAVDQLMDKEWPEDRRQAFVAVAGRHPQIRGIHDLRTRTSGANEFAQFHACLDPRMSILAAHDIVDEIEAELLQEFPDVEVIVHIDPAGREGQPPDLLAVAADEKDLQA